MVLDLSTFSTIYGPLLCGHCRHNHQNKPLALPKRCVQVHLGEQTGDGMMLVAPEMTRSLSRDQSKNSGFRVSLSIFVAYSENRKQLPVQPIGPLDEDHV